MDKIIVITAPSGSGKTSIVKELIKRNPRLSFSISACTRAARNNEKEGVDYYFIQEEDFQNKIKDHLFLEWEMVYPGKYYGTLLSEIERIHGHQQFPLVDIDVKGALNIKDKYQNNVLSIFIKAPSIEDLKQRLLQRATEDEKSLKERIEKAQEELSFEQSFDFTVVNDDLEIAINEVLCLIDNFLKS